MDDFFEMNGKVWHVKFVDPSDDILIDRTMTRTVAVTDPVEKIVYFSNELSGDFLVRVAIHELGHCALCSFDLLHDIHSFVRPEHWVEAEEWVCNFIADYGFKIFRAAYSILGEAALSIVPNELNRMLSGNNNR